MKDEGFSATGRFSGASCKTCWAEGNCESRYSVSGFDLDAGLLTHLANQNDENGCHLGKRLARMHRSQRTREVKPAVHQLVIQDQQAILDGNQFQIRRMFDEV